MNSHPLYGRPKEDQGREQRTADWDESEIVDFLDTQYDNPLEEFGADSYDRLEEKIEELGLSYDEDSDWRHEQVSDLGEKEFDWGITCGLARKEDIEERDSKPDDYVPWEVRFEDEEGEVQVEYDNR